MGTQSTIGVKNESGSVTAIYCHWDGYPEHNGRILRDYYNTPAKIAKLMKLGALSSLRAEIGRKHKWDDNTKPWCKSYKRDRGERRPANEPQVYDNVEDYRSEADGNYLYLWNGSKWICWSNEPRQTEIDLYK